MEYCHICNKQFKNKSGLTNHIKNCEKTHILKNDAISLYLDNLMGISEISKKLKITKTKVSDYISDVKRNSYEIEKIKRKKFPDKYVISNDTRKKMRESHIKWMKENPEKTAWRLANISYPEKLFLNKIKELKWNEKYLIIREKTMFPFYIDFAFENEKTAVEIDGSQHLEEERKNMDNQKDQLLIKNGWKVIRISENEIKNNIDNCMRIIQDILNENKSNEITRVGIFSEKKNLNKYKNRKEYFDVIRKEYKEKIKPKIKKIENSNIDFSKQGWVKEVSKIIGVSENYGGKWVKKYMNDFYIKNCWIRNKD